MRITGLEAIQLRLPIRGRRRLGVGDLPHVDNVLIRLFTDEGLVGLGEASPWPVFAESAEATLAVLRAHLGPALVGEDPFRIEALMAKLDRVLAGHPFAKAAIDMALHDLVGRALGQPISTLLGGRCRDRVPLSFSVAQQDTARDLDEIASLRAQGLRIFKVKTGVLPARDDLERVRRIAEALADGAELRLDYNQALTAEEALVRVRAMEAFHPTFIEQPLPKWDLEGMARIARAIDTPIVADESVFGPHDALRLVRLEAADMVSIKLMKTGGLLGAKRVAAIAEAAGLPCYAGAMWESGVGLAAHLHFACSTPIVHYGSDYYISSFLLQQDIISPPLRSEDGWIYPPDGPGLGVTLDEDAVRAFRVA